MVEPDREEEGQEVREGIGGEADGREDVEADEEGGGNEERNSEDQDEQEAEEPETPVSYTHLTLPTTPYV